MEIRKTYKGYRNGVFGIWCGFKPEDAQIEEEINVYYPDKGKIFTKDGEEFTAVVLNNGETIDMYDEVEEDI